MIEWADAAAGELLRCSPAACEGRSLIMFFAKNREGAIAAMTIARAGQVVAGSGVIRPRERRPHSVTFTLEPDPDRAGSLKWVFSLSAEV